MHLLFDAKTKACYGEVFERKGAITSISLRLDVPPPITQLYKTWGEEGIPVFRFFTQIKKGITTTSFAHEKILLSDKQAFQALVTTAHEVGLMVCSLDTERESYWKELSTWSLSETTKFELIFLAKNIPSTGLSWWKTQWNILQKQMATV